MIADEVIGRLTRTYTGSEEMNGVQFFAVRAAFQRQRVYRAELRFYSRHRIRLAGKEPLDRLPAGRFGKQ